MVFIEPVEFEIVSMTPQLMRAIVTNNMTLAKVCNDN
jgi:hypothetical protein